MRAVLAILLVAGSAAAEPRQEIDASAKRERTSGGANPSTGDPDHALARLERALPRGWSVLATENELVIRHDRPVYCVDHPNGPLVTLELRYTLEPKWTPERFAEAKAANDKIAGELAKTKGARAQAKVRARIVPMPLCTLDHSSVLERPDTYAQLKLSIDPADAKAEASQIQELVAKKCPPP